MGAVKNASAWVWVPTLYFVEGVPYFVVNNISVLALTKMGVPNGTMALFTSLLYLPWIVKPFWSPFVDILRTKRWWIIATEILMGFLMVGLTLSVPRPAHEMIEASATSINLFAPMLCLFWLTAFASATHDIAADGFYMLALDSRTQAVFVGIRSMFYRLASIFGQGGLVALAGFIELRTGDIPLSWRLTLLCASVLLCLLTLYHVFVLPRPVRDRSSMARKSEGASRILVEFGRSFSLFFSKPGVVLAIIFLLFYRLPEAFLIKMCVPFLVATGASGGLALETAEVGIVYGTIGVCALTVGGILGGWFASLRGLKASLWWMAAAMTLPCLTFVYLAIFQPQSIVIVSVAVAVEQFGYGFGFTAYMLYMMYFSEGTHQTSHYAICTAFMALSMMLPGMVAGYMEELLGYVGFFWMVIGCCLATVAVTLIVRRTVAAGYGRK